MNTPAASATRSCLRRRRKSSNGERAAMAAPSPSEISSANSGCSRVGSYAVVKLERLPPGRRQLASGRATLLGRECSSRLRRLLRYVEGFDGERLAPLSPQLDLEIELVEPEPGHGVDRDQGEAARLSEAALVDGLAAELRRGRLGTRRAGAEGHSPHERHLT